MKKCTFLTFCRSLGATIMVCVILAGSGFHSSASDNNVKLAEPILFRITQDGNNLGRHTVTFGKIDGDLHVNIAIDIKVQILFIPVYSYRHRNHEVWRGGRLISLTTETYDNGETHWVRATAEDGALAVESSNGSFKAPADTVPTSYWLPETTGKSVLLDTQHGKLVNVSISPSDESILETPAGAIAAKRYDVTGDLELSLWYSNAGDWVKTAFNVRGANIEYLLDPELMRTAERPFD